MVRGFTMATVKKSKKSKIIILICIVLVIAVIGGSIAAVSANSKITEVSLSTISTENIIETVSATGEVSSGARREYDVATVANCKEVFVKVGDSVKKGDKLATFETETLDAQVSSLQSTYNDAKASYDNAVKSQGEAKKKLNSVNKEISSLEKKLAKIQKNSRATTAVINILNKTPSLKADGANESSSSQTSPSITVPSVSVPDVTYPETLEGAMQALTDLVNTINQLANDIEQTNEITRVVMQTIAQELTSGNYSADAIADAVGKAMTKAIQEGIIDETKLIVESGIAVDLVEASVKQINWSAIGSSIANSNNAQLASTELQLAALYAEKEIFSVSSDSTTVNAQKKIMKTAKSALDTLKKSQKELQTGWVASMDGIVTECSLEAGQQVSALQTGLKIENLGSLVATISLGEYDVHKVKVGMKAVITTAYGSYTGEIISIAPTATGGSNSSILDSVGSMAGVSGLSSLTDSGAGVECVVSINEPDDNIIAGFEANVEIQTGMYSNVPTVPIEAIVLEKDGTYVYKYNEEDETVTKTQIETGAVSDTAYEITSGLSIGDKIVSTPSNYEEETFKVKVKKR